MTEDSPDQLAANLVRLLDVEEIDTDLYRGARLEGAVGRAFGGQVIAQALQAAQRSTPDKVAHSLHAYFMRPGDNARPIVLRVVRDFDGGSFATRRVIALQGGQPILNMAASFQRAEEGLAHQEPMPDVPVPERLADDDADAPGRPDAGRETRLHRFGGIEMRRIDPVDPADPQPGAPVARNWFRVVAPIGDDPAIHRAAIAYASDMALIGTSMLPHGVTYTSPGMQVASLDHALWLHEAARADEWLLYATDSPWSGHGRGINRGLIYARDGRLVASVAQEGLIRRKSVR